MAVVNILGCRWFGIESLAAPLRDFYIERFLTASPPIPRPTEELILRYGNDATIAMWLIERSRTTLFLTDVDIHTLPPFSPEVDKIVLSRTQLRFLSPEAISQVTDISLDNNPHLILPSFPIKFYKHLSLNCTRMGLKEVYDPLDNPSYITPALRIFLNKLNQKIKAVAEIHDLERMMSDL